MKQRSGTPPAAFHVMVKPGGAVCNLDCGYCYYLEKESLYPESDFRMPDSILRSFIRQYIQAQPIPRVSFAWQGGEPTLAGLDFFKRVTSLQRKYARPGMRIENALQTNGVTLDDAWCAFFKENNFLIGISIDGPALLHDGFRKDKGGRNTFDRVMTGLSLLKKHRVDFNVLTCVHNANMDHPVEVYRFLRDEVEAQFIQFIPVVERVNKKGSERGTAVASRSVGKTQYGRFLIAVFDEWIRRDVGRVFVQIFDAALAAWVGEHTSLCVFEPTCGQAMALEHNGDVYACDHFVEPGYLLGNLDRTPLVDLVAHPRQMAFGQAKRDQLPKFCRECEIRFVCNGGCPKDRFCKTSYGQPGLNYLCSSYKAFFTHIRRPMEIMANLLHARRPPNEVMRFFQ